MPPIGRAACRRCSFIRLDDGPVDSPLCFECAARTRDPVDRIIAWGRYRGTLEALIHALKYRGHHFLARDLSELLVEAWCRSAVGADLAIPVPMHPSRQRARGYNQAALLAGPFASRTGLEFAPALLKKSRNTPAQTTRKRAERLTGLRNVFMAGGSVSGRDVVLVDDVCTTGATLRACAAALRAGGAASVRAVVLARA